jgi:tetratricopeptide (TPR) repeat protein
LSALLVACADVPVAPPPVATLLFHDTAFEAAKHPVDVNAAFALTDEMRRYAHDELAPKVRTEGHRGFVHALYDHAQIRLRYDATETRTAAEAFRSRSGNCLSLVLMTAAFAKELNLPVTYQSAVVDETWSRDGSLYFVNGHVNIMLGKAIGGVRTAWDAEDRVIIDFLPQDDIRGLRMQPVSETTIGAMYLNNRAAEALTRGDIDDAYWAVRQAMQRDPAFYAAYNTLGVVYWQRGLLAEARQVFDEVLAHQPMNAQALANDAEVVELLGDHPAAAALKTRLAKIETHPPFYYFDQGMAAMQRGDYRAAREFFAQEVRRAEYHHEFHYWLAVADYQLGNIADARHEMELALENSTKRRDHDLYAAKLERLNAIYRQ